MNLKNVKEEIQVAYRYGAESIPLDITRKEILHFFFLNQAELQFIKTTTKWPEYRLALGIQLGSYKLIGRFHKNMNIIPLDIIKNQAKQLLFSVNDISFKYTERKNTILTHNKSVRKFLDLKFLPTSYHKKLINHLIAEAPDPGHYPTWIMLAEDHLRKEKFILPTMKVLTRIIMSARNKGLDEILDKVYSQLTEEMIKNLDSLLEGNNNSKWSQYTNRRFYKASSKKINEILASINDIKILNLSSINFDGINESYLQYFTLRGTQMAGKQLKDQSAKSRYVLMVVSLNNLLGELTDISIQMNDEIISGIFLTGETKSNDYFKTNRKIVKRILSAFHFVSGTMLEENLSGLEKLRLINSKIPRDLMEELNSKTALLNIPRGTEKLYFASNSYQRIQKYLPQLLETFKISSFIKEDPLVEAAEYYLDRKKNGLDGIGKDAPCDFVTKKNWKKVVFDVDGSPKPKPWIVCIADCMRSSLRKGTINVDGTKQYRSLDFDLIPQQKFRKLNLPENKNLPFTSPPGTVINSIGRAIKELSQKEDEWKNNDTAYVDNENKIHFRKLDKIEEPESVISLRTALYGSLKDRLFADVLIEADRLTGYTSQLTRLSSGLPIKSIETKLGGALYSVLYAVSVKS